MKLFPKTFEREYKFKEAVDIARFSHWPDN